MSRRVVEDANEDPPSAGAEHHTLPTLQLDGCPQPRFEFLAGECAAHHTSSPERSPAQPLELRTLQLHEHTRIA